MVNKAFSRPFTQQEPINQEAIDAATQVLKSGRLHRYNTIEEVDYTLDKIKSIVLKGK